MNDQSNLAAAIEKIRELTNRAASIEIVTNYPEGDGDRPGITLLGRDAQRHVQTLDHLMERQQAGPHRPTGTTELATPQAFADWARFFADPARALIFADADRRALEVVLDHDRAAGGELLAGTAWREWRGRCQLRHDPAWLAWAGIEKAGPLAPTDFAEAIEDRVADIGPPAWPTPEGAADPVTALAEMLAMRVGDRAEIVALSRTFRVKVESEVASAQTLQSGEVAITYKQEHKDELGERVKAPGLFALMAPVFEHGPIYRLPVKLRYRAAGGGVKWSIQRHRPDIAEREAFDLIVADVAQRSGLTVFRGAAPAPAQTVSPSAKVSP